MSLYDLILDKVKPWLPIRCWNCVVDNVFQIRSGTLTPGFVLTLVDTSGTAQWAASSGGGSVTAVLPGTGINVVNGTTTPTVSTSGNFGGQNLSGIGTLTVGGASTFNGILQTTNGLLSTGNLFINPGSTVPPDGAYLRSSGGSGIAVWDTLDVPATFVTTLARSNVAITIGGTPYPSGSGAMTVGFTGNCTGVALVGATSYSTSGATTTAGHNAVFGSLTVNNSVAAPKVPAAGDYLQAANSSGDCKWVTVTPGTVTSVNGGTGITVTNGTTSAVVNFSGGSLGATSFTTVGTVTIGAAGGLALQGHSAAAGFWLQSDAAGNATWVDPTTVAVTQLAVPLGNSSILLSANQGVVDISATGAFGSAPITTTGSVTASSGLVTNGGSLNLGGGAITNASTATINPGAGFATGLILPNGAGTGLVLTSSNTGAATWSAAPAGAVTSVTAADGSVAVTPPGGTGAVTVAATGAFGAKNISTSGTLGVVGTSTLGTTSVTSLSDTGDLNLTGDLNTDGNILMLQSGKSLTVLGTASVSGTFTTAGQYSLASGSLTSFTSASLGIGAHLSGGPLLITNNPDPAFFWTTNVSTQTNATPVSLTPAAITSGLILLQYTGGGSTRTDPQVNVQLTWQLPTYNALLTYLTSTLKLPIVSAGLTWECRMICPVLNLTGQQTFFPVAQVNIIESTDASPTSGVRFLRADNSLLAFQRGRTSYNWNSDPPQGGSPAQGSNYQGYKSFVFILTDFVDVNNGIVQVVY